MECLRFCCQLLWVFRSYFGKRKQSVFYDHRSEEYMTTSGVPQDSNLEPLLFWMYINHLIESLQCKYCFLPMTWQFSSKLTSQTTLYYFKVNLTQYIHGVFVTGCHQTLKNVKYVFLNPSNISITSETGIY